MKDKYITFTIENIYLPSKCKTIRKVAKTTFISFSSLFHFFVPIISTLTLLIPSARTPRSEC